MSFSLFVQIPLLLHALVDLQGIGINNITITTTNSSFFTRLLIPVYNNEGVYFVLPLFSIFALLIATPSPIVILASPDIIAVLGSIDSVSGSVDLISITLIHYFPFFL